VTDDNTLLSCEFVLALGKAELDEIGGRRVANFLFDVGALCINQPFRPSQGTTIRASVAPWEPQCVLFDAPLAEPEHLEAFQADGITVELLAVIPIFEGEMAFIEGNGIEAFDAVARRSDFSLADVRRPSLV
jgi:hypothetical protein